MISESKALGGSKAVASRIIIAFVWGGIVGSILTSAEYDIPGLQKSAYNWWQWTDHGFAQEAKHEKALEEDDVRVRNFLKQAGIDADVRCPKPPVIPYSPLANTAYK